VASKEQASADPGEEVAILSLKDGVYYGLDPVGARIWKLVQTPQTVREIRDTLLAEYDVESDRCERDLIALLEELTQRQLIEVIDNV
jgi:Coenzyme PQQ synthesis protein D (PqqD)